MARYAQVPRSIHREAWFRSLSELSQRVCMYILTCESGGILPVFSLRTSTVAEDLRLKPFKVKEAFAELAAAGFLERDEEAALVLIVKFWDVAMLPRGPKQTPGAGNAFRTLPECALARSAFFRIAAALTDADREIWLRGAPAWLSTTDTLSDRIGYPARGRASPCPSPIPKPTTKPAPPDHDPDRPPGGGRSDGGGGEPNPKNRKTPSTTTPSSNGKPKPAVDASPLALDPAAASPVDAQPPTPTEPANPVATRQPGELAEAALLVAPFGGDVGLALDLKGIWGSRPHFLGAVRSVVARGFGPEVLSVAAVAANRLLRRRDQVDADPAALEQLAAHVAAPDGASAAPKPMTDDERLFANLEKQRAETMARDAKVRADEDAKQERWAAADREKRERLERERLPGETIEQCALRQLDERHARDAALPEGAFGRLGETGFADWCRVRDARGLPHPPRMSGVPVPKGYVPPPPAAEIVPMRGRAKPLVTMTSEPEPVRAAGGVR